MLEFFIGLLLLVIGYLTYGRFVEKVIGPDDRQTPAVSMHDGVDYVCLPHWKNMLIQLLNIAGVGPVIGVIIGIKFGAMVFLIIPIGNIIAGATHDFLAGMMSIRNGGSNLPSIVKDNLGGVYSKFFSVFTILLLLLVVTVFINVPANLFNDLFPSTELFWWAVGAIFAYYILATLFPVDKIIGKFYPFFGAVLIVGTAAILCAIVYGLFENPAILSESEAFRARMWNAANGHPVIPLLFVTIACGIISGFHATQSPIIARTMKTERQARSSFYGMMVLEGVIAMVWAAAGMAIYNAFPEYMAKNPNFVLLEIARYFLGEYVGVLTVAAVIVLAITTGDTAMRSVRLSFSEMFNISQKPLKNRILVSLPFVAVILALIVWSQTDAASFNNLWNYFAWGNQVLAASTLFAGAVWLFRQSKNGFVALLPAMFMCFIVISYIAWISPRHGGPVGFGADINLSYLIAGVLTLVAAVWVYRRGRK